MGLDMYLTKKVYVGANYDFNNITGKIDLYANGEKIDIDLKKVTNIELNAGYWRKANAIHQWFVDNVQEGNDNCGEYYVDEEMMQKLLVDVNSVLADHSLASKLLPTANGFFFGGTEYDERYFEQLEDTKKILEEAIANPGDYYYSSSW